jgi:hypothetical protein
MLRFTSHEYYDFLTLTVPRLYMLHDEHNGKFTPMYMTKKIVYVGSVPCEYDDETEYEYENKVLNILHKKYDDNIKGYLELVIDIGLSEGLSVNFIFYTTLNDIFKGDVDIPLNLKKSDYVEYFYTFFDNLISRNGKFPVDLIFTQTNNKNNITFQEEVSRYNFKGLCIDYLVKRKIQKDFSKYCNWKHIKAMSYIGYMKDANNKKLSIDEINSITIEKRFSILKFHSEYLSKIKGT